MMMTTNKNSFHTYSTTSFRTWKLPTLSLKELTRMYSVALLCGGAHTVLERADNSWKVVERNRRMRRRTNHVEDFFLAALKSQVEFTGANSSAGSTFA